MSTKRPPPSSPSRQKRVDRTFFVSAETRARCAVFDDWRAALTLAIGVAFFAAEEAHCFVVLNILRTIHILCTIHHR